VRRRRDRRDRGLRGELVPPGVPLRRSRAEQFDDLVLDAVEHLEQRWAEQLHGVEFAVEEVPPPPGADLELIDLLDDPVPLGRIVPGTAGRHGQPPRVVVHRRPVEARASDKADLADLVLDVVIHQLADLLGVDPAVIDPEGHGDPDDED
jgi:predicted Zn-dependent protease with MMP-like domain